MHLNLRSLVAILLIVLLVTVGCNSSQHAQVRLNEKSEIPSVQQAAGGANGSEPLRVAIAGVLSPTETLKTYQQLLAYMEEELDREVTLIQRRTYSEINDLVRGQHVQVAFICSGAYIPAARDFGMELLVVPQMYGETVYYSYLIVPQNSGAQNLADLRGASFAFSDPLSNSGRLAPTYQLYLLGETPDSFFYSYVFTYSHNNSIIAVAKGLVDGAAVDSLIYDSMVEENPELASTMRIIARWGPYGIPPIVVNPELDLKLKAELRDFFLSLDSSAEGRRILNDLAIDHFLLAEEDLYDSVREMFVQLGW